MKRTRSINLERMRKRSRGFALKPLALGVAAATLVACGSNSRDAEVYQGVQHCVDANPQLATECREAYKKAQEKSIESGPKYSSLNDCIAEFGVNQCVVHTTPTGQSWFMPAVAGFMLARAIDRPGYHSAPLYTSYAHRSPMFGRWTTVDGYDYGDKRFGRMKVKGSAFEPKPKVTRTMSRGGFGSTVAAKSNWGGRSSARGGWGG